MSFDMLPAYDRMRLLHSNPVTVTLTRPASPLAAQLSVVVRYVQEQAAGEETVDSPLGGALGGTRRAFRLWQVECLLPSGTGYLTPHQGHLITDEAGDVWHVDSVDVLCKGASFRCHCTRRPS